MPKPLGYYADSSTALDELQEAYGSRLEGLTAAEKLHLLSILANYAQAILEPHLQDDREDFSLEAVLWDISPYMPTDKVTDAVEILDDSDRPAQMLYGLMQAIAAQLNGG